MIKVPATEAGLPAIAQLTAAGVNVNVTLLFSVERYVQVIEAYLRGLERRVQAGQPIAGIRSVASFFVSRVDAKADARLPTDSPFKGRVGAANALAAYDSYRDVLYLESLALPGSILTVPEPTLVAFADHGEPQPAVATSATAAVDLPAITAELEREGVDAFCAAYCELLGSIKERAQALRADAGRLPALSR